MIVDSSQYIGDNFSNLILRAQIVFQKSLINISAHDLSDKCKLKDFIKNISNLYNSINKDQYNLDELQKVINFLHNIAIFYCISAKIMLGRREYQDSLFFMSWSHRLFSSLFYDVCKFDPLQFKENQLLNLKTYFIYYIQQTLLMKKQIEQDINRPLYSTEILEESKMVMAEVEKKFFDTKKNRERLISYFQ